jgi:hypothetical protein
MDMDFHYKQALATMIAIDAANALELGFVGSGSKFRIVDLTFCGDPVRFDGSLLEHSQTQFRVLATTPDGDEQSWQVVFAGVMPEEGRAVVAREASQLLRQICRRV